MPSRGNFLTRTKKRRRRRAGECSIGASKLPRPCQIFHCTPFLNIQRQQVIEQEWRAPMLDLPELRSSTRPDPSQRFPTACLRDREENRTVSEGRSESRWTAALMGVSPGHLPALSCWWTCVNTLR